VADLHTFKYRRVVVVLQQQRLPAMPASQPQQYGMGNNYPPQQPYFQMPPYRGQQPQQQYPPYANNNMAPGPNAQQPYVANNMPPTQQNPQPGSSEPVVNGNGDNASSHGSDKLRDGQQPQSNMESNHTAMRPEDGMQQQQGPNNTNNKGGYGGYDTQQQQQQPPQGLAQILSDQRPSGSGQANMAGEFGSHPAQQQQQQPNGPYPQPNMYNGPSDQPAANDGGYYPRPGGVNMRPMAGYGGMPMMQRYPGQHAYPGQGQGPEYTGQYRPDAPPTSMGYNGQQGGGAYWNNSQARMGYPTSTAASSAPSQTMAYRNQFSMSRGMPPMGTGPRYGTNEQQQYGGAPYSQMAYRGQQPYMPQMMQGQGQGPQGGHGQYPSQQQQPPPHPSASTLLQEQQQNSPHHPFSPSLQSPRSSASGPLDRQTPGTRPPSAALAPTSKLATADGSTSANVDVTQNGSSQAGSDVHDKLPVKVDSNGDIRSLEDSNGGMPPSSSQHLQPASDNHHLPQQHAGAPMEYGAPHNQQQQPYGMYPSNDIVPPADGVPGAYGSAGYGRPPMSDMGAPPRPMMNYGGPGGPRFPNSQQMMGPNAMNFDPSSGGPRYPSHAGEFPANAMGQQFRPDGPPSDMYASQQQQYWNRMNYPGGPNAAAAYRHQQMMAMNRGMAPPGGRYPMPGGEQQQQPYPGMSPYPQQQMAYRGPLPPQQQAMQMQMHPHMMPQPSQGPGGVPNAFGAPQGQGPPHPQLPDTGMPPLISQSMEHQQRAASPSRSLSPAPSTGDRQTPVTRPPSTAAPAPHSARKETSHSVSYSFYCLCWRCWL
jgi:hypothetical protein